MNKIKTLCKDYFLTEEFYCILNKKEFCISYSKTVYQEKNDVAVNLDFIFLFQSAVHDHDYLSLPFTEYWVDEAIKVHVLSS